MSPETYNLDMHKEHTLSPKAVPAFRQPTGDDYTAVSEIHNAQNEPDLHYTPEQLRRIDLKAGEQDLSAKRYVAVLDGEIIATGYLWPSWWGYKYPGRYWTGIYVRKDYRNQGVDTQLLHHALENLNSPAEEVWTVVREDFTGAAGFLRDENFTRARPDLGRTFRPDDV